MKVDQSVYHLISIDLCVQALCPVHGFMVRRNYDYSVSNSEEVTDEELEVHKVSSYSNYYFFNCRDLLIFHYIVFSPTNQVLVDLNR